MPPDTARVQDAALARFDRLQSKEDKARKQYELDKGKSDATLKRLAAKAATDAAAQKALDDVQGGKGDQKDGNPARGPIQGGKGMGPHKKNPVGDKSVKEAARFSKKLAAESKKNQLPPSTAGVNEAPPAQVTSGGDLGQNLGQQPPATAPASVPATGSSVDIAKDTTNSPPSEFAAKIGETGKNITGAATTEVQAQNSAAPVFNATMVGAPKGPVDPKQAQADQKLEVDRGDKAKAPTLRKETRIRAVKGKPGSDIKGAGDAGADALKALFSASLNKIDTQSTTNTSPGPAPTVQLQGEADPARGNEAMDEAKEKSDAAYVKHVEAIEAGPGPEVVQPQDMQEEVKPELAELPQIPDVPTPDQAVEYLAKGHDQPVYDKADELKAADFDTSLAEAEAKFEEANTSLETDHAAKLEEASSAVDEENKKAQEKQEAEVTAARADIDEGRKGTKKAQEEELKKAKKKGDAEKKATQQKIEKRRKDDDRKIAKKYKEGEKKAEAKKKAAEKKAAAEKKKAEAKKEDQSWWDRAASAVGSFIDTIASAVTTIFDAMAKAVGDILNAVKDAAMGMIDAAMSFATSALDVLGDALKSMVTNLIGDVFPGLAAALNDLIDSAVDAAKGAIEAIGEQLKAAVAAAIDALNAGIQAVINAYKTAISTALAIASAAVSGDWEAVFKAMLEGALSLAGVDPAQFYQLVGEGMDTINAIIDDPGSFVGNMIDAVGQGFGQFADNFGSHLLNGAVEWLTGSLGEAGITLPETWDAAGIFGMIADILGVSWDGLKGKIGERIGEDNVAMLESIWGYVEAAMNGGIAGLWDHAKDQLGDLWQGLLDSALAMLTEQIITAAIMKIATMWNPAGAIVQALITVWNVYSFVQEQAQRIMGLVTSVVDSMSNIVAGQLGQAANFIEGSLADLVPVAISLLANLLGLGGISKKVKGIIDSIQEQVDKAIDWVLDKLFELGKAAFDALKGTMGGGKDDPAAEQAAAEGANEAPAEEQQPEGGDPSKLPSTTLLSTAGNMDLGWDAQRGGQGASAKLTGGPFAGKVGAEAIGKMQAEAAKMEGPGKAEADQYIGTARTQVLAVDSRGGKYIRGEELDLAPISASFDLLARALLGGANAIGDETGGDKDSSVADHERLATVITNELGQPVTPVPETYADWGIALERKAAELQLRYQGELEPDVNLRVTLPESIDRDMDDGALNVHVEIAPNTTDDDEKVPLAAPFDWRSSLDSEKFKESLSTYTMLAINIGMSSIEARKDAEEFWRIAITTLQSTNSEARFKDLPADAKTKDRKDLHDPAFKVIMDDLKPIIDALEKYMSAQAEYKSDKTWGFWSGTPAQQCVEANADMTLEKSALGALFNGVKIEGSWHIEMWGALSRAFATWAADNFEKRTFVGFVGWESWSDASIFNMVEQPTFQKLAESRKGTPNITWHAAATRLNEADEFDPSKTSWNFKEDLSNNAGGARGSYASSKGMGGRQAMVTHVRGEHDKLKELLARKKQLLDMDIELRSGDPTTRAWMDKAKAAGELYAQLHEEVDDIGARLRLAKVSDTVKEKVDTLTFESGTTPDALRALVTTYEPLLPGMAALQAAHAKGTSAHIHGINHDDMRASLIAAKAALKLAEMTDSLLRSEVEAQLAIVKEHYTNRSHRTALQTAFDPIFDHVFTMAATSVDRSWASIAKDAPGNTDQLWSDTAIVQSVKDEAYAWKEVAGQVLTKRRDRAKFQPALDRMAQAEKVVNYKTEYEAWLREQPADIRGADKALVAKPTNEILKVGADISGAWIRALNSLKEAFKSDREWTFREVTHTVREVLGSALAGFGMLTPAVIGQITTAVADRIWEMRDERAELNRQLALPADAEDTGEAVDTNALATTKGEQEGFLITAGNIMRLAGIWTATVPFVGWVGPAMAALGRFFVSFGTKLNIGRAIVEAASEAAVLYFFKATGVLGAAAIATTVAGTAATVGGAITPALTTDASRSQKQLKELADRIVGQEFSIPLRVQTRLDFFNNEGENT